MSASVYVPVDIGGFTVDAAIEEMHDYSCTVSQFPVEKGATFSDHVQLNPIGLRLDCIVTDTPIGPMEKVRGSVGSFTGEGFTQWSDEAHEHFKKLRAKREPFDVVTSLQTYHNMVIESYSPTRRAGDGFALRFTLNLKFIGIVENGTAFVRTATPNSKKKSKLGTKPTKQPPEDAGITPARAEARARNAAAEAARKNRNSWLGNGLESAIGPSWMTGVQ